MELDGLSTKSEIHFVLYIYLSLFNPAASVELNLIHLVFLWEIPTKYLFQLNVTIGMSLLSDWHSVKLINLEYDAHNLPVLRCKHQDGKF
jgi:hypothetical protein